MTQDVAIEAPGLHVMGEVSQGFPLPRQSYARAAYGNTEPDMQKAHWSRCSSTIAC